MPESVYSRIKGLVSKEDPGKLCLLTLLEGEGAGEKALYSDERLIEAFKPGGFFETMPERLPDISAPGCYEAGRLFYAEILGRPERLVICGAGHVSIPIIKLGKLIGCHTTCIDDREEYVGNARQAGADRVLCGSFEEVLSGLEGSSDTYFIVVTRMHRYDSECIRAIAGKKHAYIGLMGSRRRTAVVKEKLLEEGVSPELVSSIHTPIGIDINSETPEEIAVSIIAEIIKIKNQFKKNTGFSEEMLEKLTGLEGSKKAVLATIVKRIGSAPRDVGSKMLIEADGSLTGTIGGGCTEAFVIEHAGEMLKGKAPEFSLHSLSLADEWYVESETVCGGTIEVFLETV
ncbi:MAG: XdhC family protein [Lachnospiraceae bacterium]|nr:XdhC family protein [Lachnospiraceae bacterium]